jgi:Lrp/AsnC family transcriptional regulator for asnA, asnC and gidA
VEEIDSVDLKLLRALARNSRTPLKELGRELGLSISGVRRRINKLIKKGVIKGYSIVVDPKKYGWNITAFIKIDIESAYLKELMNRLARKREVCEVHKTGGDSILIKVRFRDIDELNRFVEDITASGEGVKNVATFISMECFKETPVSI